ncbi:uncharacterized protein SOCE26_092100 [Sorangium cellulosum]|uniref:Uncharacterized protein n=1 Tax=Sorangium cellulosum TaxID=56 RepID=A0A2L0F7X4_SORCE|nr:hypothetical protein [Sorangium cellulosum]AUX47686.1 uncharacterized protein SOCE26_092100 [Sorangium cellulosum]
MKNEDRKFDDTAAEIRTEAQILDAVRDIELTVRQIQDNPNKLIAAKVSTLSSLCTSACFSSASTIATNIEDQGTDGDADARIHERALADG